MKSPGASGSITKASPFVIHVKSETFQKEKDREIRSPRQQSLTPRLRSPRWNLRMGAKEAADTLGRDLEAMGYDLNCKSFITKASTSSEDTDRYAATAKTTTALLNNKKNNKKAWFTPNSSKSKNKKKAGRNFDWDDTVNPALSGGKRNQKQRVPLKSYSEPQAFSSSSESEDNSFETNTESKLFYSEEPSLGTNTESKIFSPKKNSLRSPERPQKTAIKAKTLATGKTIEKDHKPHLQITTHSRDESEGLPMEVVTPRSTYFESKLSDISEPHYERYENTISPTNQMYICPSPMKEVFPTSREIHKVQKSVSEEKPNQPQQFVPEMTSVTPSITKSVSLQGKGENEDHGPLEGIVNKEVTRSLKLVEEEEGISIIDLELQETPVKKHDSKRDPRSRSWFLPLFRKSFNHQEKMSTKVSNSKDAVDINDTYLPPSDLEDVLSEKRIMELLSMPPPKVTESIEMAKDGDILAINGLTMAASNTHEDLFTSMMGLIEGSCKENEVSSVLENACVKRSNEIRAPQVEEYRSNDPILRESFDNSFSVNEEPKPMPINSEKKAFSFFRGKARKKSFKIKMAPKNDGCISLHLHPFGSQDLTTPAQSATATGIQAVGTPQSTTTAANQAIEVNIAGSIQGNQVDNAAAGEENEPRFQVIGLAGPRQEDTKAIKKGPTTIEPIRNQSSLKASIQKPVFSPGIAINSIFSDEEADESVAVTLADPLPPPDLIKGSKKIGHTNGKKINARPKLSDHLADVSTKEIAASLDSQLHPLTDVVERKFSMIGFDRSSLVGDDSVTWAELADSSKIVGKPIKRLEDIDDTNEADYLKAALSVESSLGDVEDAIVVLKRHASRLGVRERDLLLALKSDDDLTDEGSTAEDSVKIMTLGEEIADTLKFYFSVFGGKKMKPYKIE